MLCLERLAQMILEVLPTWDSVILCFDKPHGTNIRTTNSDVTHKLCGSPLTHTDFNPLLYRLQTRGTLMKSLIKCPAFLYFQLDQLTPTADGKTTAADDKRRHLEL